MLGRCSEGKDKRGIYGLVMFDNLFPFLAEGVQDLWSPFCTAKDVLTNIIIYMKKFLDCDWLREMEFFGNTVRKKGNRVQIRGNKRGILIG